MVRDRVALTGRVITVERVGALPIEVSGRLVLIEVRDRRNLLVRHDANGLRALGEVVPVEIHYLVPRADEVTHELLLSVI